MIKIICDFREKQSGLPDLLSDSEIDLTFSTLLAGDYIINDQIIIERKTAGDFIQSIIDNRLFEQCSKLKKETLRVLILIEGNPYKTDHKIDSKGIRGAILSILAAWQIPVIYSHSKENSIELMLMLGTQSIKNTPHVKQYNNFKKKKSKSQKMQFLQGIPSTGPSLAYRLIEKFGTITSIVNAPEYELRQINGIGKLKAKKIKKFFSE